MGYSSEQKELLDAIQVMIDSAMEKIPVITSGVVIALVSDNIYTVNVNGKTYDLPHYGTSTVNINTTVKVFVPYNNFSIAWFL